MEDDDEKLWKDKHTTEYRMIENSTISESPMLFVPWTTVDCTWRQVHFSSFSTRVRIFLEIIAPSFEILGWSVVVGPCGCGDWSLGCRLVVVAVVWDKLCRIFVHKLLLSVYYGWSWDDFRASN